MSNLKECKLLSRIITAKGNKWKVKCFCGNVFEAFFHNIKSKHTKSCGCLKKEKEKNRTKNYRNVINKNGIKILAPLIEDKNTSIDYWIALCPVCNNAFNTLPNRILFNNMKSCGCDKYRKSTIKVKEYHIKKRILLNLDPLKYVSPLTETIRKNIFYPIKNIIIEIDNYSCKLCGSNKNLKVHHIDPIKNFINYKDKTTFIKLYDLNNLITLCHECHFYKAHNSSGHRLNLILKDRFIQMTLNRNISIDLINKYKEKIEIIKNWINECQI